MVGEISALSSYTVNSHFANLAKSRDIYEYAAGTALLETRGRHIFSMTKLKTMKLF